MDSIVAAPPPYKSRRGWLIAFGVVEILFGCLFLLMIALSAFAFFGPAAAGMPPGAMAVAPVSRSTLMVLVALQYGILAAVFFTGGIGSIRCLNWARVLMMAVSGLWLGLGVIATIGLALMFRVMRAQPAVPTPNMQHAIMAGMMIGATVFMILLPAVFLFFYTRESVKATCLARTGVEAAPLGRGESGLPDSLAALGVWEGLSAVAVFALFFMQVALVFGFVVHGVLAVVIMLAHSILSAYAAWSIFRQKVIGWNIAMAKAAFWTMSTAVTYLRHPDLQQVYRDMGINTRAPSLYEQFPQLLPVFWVGMIVGFTALIVFLLYTRKYFPPERRA